MIIPFYACTTNLTCGPDIGKQLMKDATSWVYGLQHSGGMASLSANATQLQFLGSGPHLVKRRRVRWYIWVVGRLELPCIKSS